MSLREMVFISVLTMFLWVNSLPARAECDKGFVSKEEAVETRGIELAGKNLAASVPLTSPSAAQALAPSGGGSVVTTVNKPDFSSLISMAIEDKLIDSSKGVYTVSVTPFTFLTLARPEYLSDQSLYVQPLPTWFRRFDGKISLGGKGDSFDRNHDGKPDDALEAKKLTDIVTWEVLYRFWGSRDRRDPSNFKSFDEAVRGKFSDLLDAEAQFLIADNFMHDLGKLNPDSHGCYPEKELKVILKKPEYVQALSEIGAAETGYKQAADAVFKKIDNNFLLTFVVGGTQRDQVFGPNKRSLGLRGAFGTPGSDGTHSANAEWSKVYWSDLREFLQAPDAEVYTLGYEFSTLWLKGSVLSNDGITVALSGSSEWLRNVPMSKHGQNTKVNAKLSIPISKGISLPISVTWANHKDLLTEDKIQGHIGFTIDFYQLSNKSKGSSS